ncbi:MAG TPA: DUF1638 domain-containing protein [Candidatus Nanopelagicales bacterium]|nr:DUF1638 domain-containing protein [Candidatus Nanopelagicales bacterium]
MRLLALTCEVLARPVYLCAARSPHVVDVHLNRRGLHDDPPNLRTILQGEIDTAGAAVAPYDAILLAYGLCGAATAGLRAGSIPLVVPRAHDCITLFLGSRDRYTAEFTGHPGTYWYVQDFVERSDDGGAFAGMGAVSDAEARATYEEYVAKYGEDNAAYLMEALGAWRSHYDRAAFVDMAVADPRAAAVVEAFARDDATRRGWTFEKLAGELILVRRLIDADWGPDDFLVLQPGERLEMSYDEAVIRAAPAG